MRWNDPKIVTAAIAALAVVVAAVITVRCGAAQEASSSAVTSGNYSPSVVAGGDVVITQGLAREVGDALLSWAEKSDRDTAALREALESSYRRNLSDVPADAEAWADKFLSTMPDRRANLQLREDKKRAGSRDRLARIPPLFRLADATFDARARALAERMNGASYSRTAELGEIYRSTKKHELVVGILKFPNGCQLVAVFAAGVIEDGFVREDPTYFVREPSACESEGPLRIEMSSRQVTLGSPPAIKVGAFMSDGGTEALSDRLAQRLDWIVGEVAAR